MPQPVVRGPIHAEGFLAGDLLGKMIPVFDGIRKDLCANRPGGYFCFADGRSGNPFLIAKIGDPPWPKSEKYLLLCIEKVRRLAAFPGHISSWQTRDESLDHFGGAIRAKAPLINGELSPVILSFSGLTEEADEMFMVRLALRFEMIDADDAEKIITAHPG